MEHLLEAGIWSVGGLILGYLIIKPMVEIKVRLEHIESLEEKREARETRGDHTRVTEEAAEQDSAAPGG